MRRISLPAIALVLAALPAAAPAPHGDGLEARHVAFLRAVLSDDRDSMAAFFPRRGDWTWVQTLMEAPAGRERSVRRFAAADARATIGAGGAACMSFEQGSGGSGPFETLFGMRVRRSGRRWRRVRGNRFVPPGEPAGSPTFVQWRREDGRWVVSAVGDADFYSGPRVAGVSRELVRDTVTPLPPTPVYATGQSWYVNNETVPFAGRAYLKIGLPRRIDPAQLRRVGRFGMIGIYGDPTPRSGHLFDTIFLPTAPGEYQVYQVPETMPDCG